MIHCDLNMSLSSLKSKRIRGNPDRCLLKHVPKTTKKFAQKILQYQFQQELAISYVSRLLLAVSWLLQNGIACT